MPWFFECDGCRARLEQGFETRNLALKNELVKANPALPAQYMAELFCTDCAPQAGAYWSAKADVVAKAVRVYESTVENHRRSFFGKSKIKAVT